MSDRPGPQKSADAYRTISEVADALKLPQHVLRFWETRFPQVQPLKRAGGRRFYRPEDVALLRAVQALLYDEGYTIKGVQRLIAEFGARHVADALARSRAAGTPEGTVAGVPVAVAPRGAAADGEERGEVPRRSEPSFEPGRQGSARPQSDRDSASRPAADARGDLSDRLTDVLSELAECARSLATVRSIDS